MNEREFMDADYEVIRMVNRKAGPGGQLPCATLTFIPSDRAERVEALDHRIQQLRNAMPLLVVGACLLCWLIGLSM